MGLEISKTRDVTVLFLSIPQHSLPANPKHAAFFCTIENSRQPLYSIKKNTRNTPNVSKMASSTPAPDRKQRELTAGPADGPEPPFPLKLSGKVIKGFGRGSKEVRLVHLHSSSHLHHVRMSTPSPAYARYRWCAFSTTSLFLRCHLRSLNVSRICKLQTFSPSFLGIDSCTYFQHLPREAVSTSCHKSNAPRPLGILGRLYAPCPTSLRSFRVLCIPLSPFFTRGHRSILASLQAARVQRHARSRLSRLRSKTIATRRSGSFALGASPMHGRRKGRQRAVDIRRLYPSGSGVHVSTFHLLGLSFHLLQAMFNTASSCSPFATIAPSLFSSIVRLPQCSSLS